MRAIIVGAGPAGFACAKWLNDRGYDVVLVEKRHVPGGKVSAWRDADGDWVESGLHVFFGAYHQLLNFLAECGLHDSFDWKPAEMVFISPAHGLTPIRFVPRLPAPLNGLAGVAASRLMTTTDKLRMALGLLWPIFGSQAYIDKQDDQSYAAWHLRHGMGRRTLDDLTHTMVLGRKVDHLCYDAAANRITGFALDDGSSVQGDVYVSAMPVHSLRKRLAPALQEQPFFGNLRYLNGQPVITAQLYFDRMVTGVDNLIFSAGTR